MDGPAWPTRLIADLDLYPSDKPGGGWFEPWVSPGYHGSLAQADRRRHFLEWLGIPGPEPCYREDDEVTWSGERLRVSHRLLGMFGHEVGHWLVASPARRKLPDFGLGELSNDPDALFNLPPELCAEEHRAVIAGIAVCDALGIQDRIVGAVKFEGWKSIGIDRHCRDAWNWLGYHNILWSNGRLTGKHRTWEDGYERTCPPE